jgi:3-hydroxyisobutyrate dehydrogenase-like beta-hydroxyacid dehydrogenase
VIGIVGFGRMGQEMARWLISQGDRVVCFDPAPSTAERAATLSVDVAPSLADLASLCTDVIVSLPGPEEVAEVVGGSHGLLTMMRPGSLIVDTSTTDPTTVRTLARAAERATVHYVDSPVTGGTRSAGTGQLTAIVGASEAGYERSRALLERIAREVVHVGGPGHGQVMKLCVQMLAFGEVALMAEAMVVGTRLGLSLDTMNEVFCSSSAASGITKTYGDRIATGALHDAEFPAWMAFKDQSLYAQIAGEARVPTPVSSTVRDIYATAVAHALGDADSSIIVSVIEGMAGPAPDCG